MSGNTHSVGDQIRSGLKGIHGAGEAIRGTAMEEVDKVLDPKSSSRVGPSENQAIAEKGKADMKAADDTLGHNHGVKSGAANTAPTTSDGAHSTAPANIGSTGSTVGTGPGGVQELQSNRELQHQG